MKSLYSYAFKRKSFRRFNPELHISQNEIALIKAYLDNGIKYLDNEYLFSYRIVPRNETNCKRGEYGILIYSKINGPHLMNIGYAFEQLDLYLSSIDIGACWYGMGKISDNKAEDNLDYIIMIAIGKAEKTEFRKDYTKAKRKDVAEIWQGNQLEEITDYIKYAPSTCNSQPWLITYLEQSIRIEMKSKEKMIVPKDKISFYNSIDMGIMLCFIEMWLQKNKIAFNRKIFKTNVLYKSGDVVAKYNIKLKKEGAFMIRLVTDKDLNEWLDLAREVEPLFGKMAESEDFKKGIIDCISNSSSFCVVNNNNDLEGIVAINKVCNEVSWLAVRERCRGKGYGYQLVEVALDSLDNSKPIFVQTFSPGVKAGEAARKMYMRFGFKDFKDGGKNPAGIDTIIMKLEE